CMWVGLGDCRRLSSLLPDHAARSWHEFFSAGDCRSLRLLRGQYGSGCHRHFAYRTQVAAQDLFGMLLLVLTVLLDGCRRRGPGELLQSNGGMANLAAGFARRLPDLSLLPALPG